MLVGIFFSKRAKTEIRRLTQSRTNHANANSIHNAVAPPPRLAGGCGRAGGLRAQADQGELRPDVQDGGRLLQGECVCVCVWVGGPVRGLL